MSEKPIIAIVSITISTLASFNVGRAYIGSLIGNIAYLLSVLFLIAFVTVNILHRQKIEDLSKGKSCFICIAYLSVIPLIYLINDLSIPLSIFLIGLFFLYFFLALIWTIIVEKRAFTNVCIVLFILCLIPLTCGFYVHCVYEEPISDEIDLLRYQIYYYDKDFKIFNEAGSFEKNIADSIERNIKELGELIKKAEDDCLIAEFDGARKRVKEGNNRTDYLRDKFVESDPRKRWHHELTEIDIKLKDLSCRASLAHEGIKYSSPENVYQTERVTSRIKSTMNKSDEAWVLFRKGDFENTSKSVKQIKKEIFEIESTLKHIEEVYEPLISGFEAIFTIAVLLAVVYILRRRKR